MKCRDCGLPLMGKQCEGKIQSVLDKEGSIVGETAGHEGICCDCFDEKLGMPAEKRIRPRPLSSL